MEECELWGHAGAQLVHVPAVQPWACYFTSLDFDFFVRERYSERKVHSGVPGKTPLI